MTLLCRSRQFIAMISLFALLAVAVGYGLQEGTGAQETTPTGHHSGQEQNIDATQEVTSVRSPYADAYDRTASIHSLSAEEIKQIRQGGGASFALPAELNGIPGPRHVLDLAEELALTHEQVARIQSVYDQFRADAIPAGEHYLTAVQALEEGFRTGTLSEENLRDRVAEVSRLEGELVTFHLMAHLQTADILTSEQIATYNKLRGYQ